MEERNGPTMQEKIERIGGNLKSSDRYYFEFYHTIPLPSEQKLKPCSDLFALWPGDESLISFSLRLPYQIYGSLTCHFS